MPSTVSGAQDGRVIKTNLSSMNLQSGAGERHKVTSEQPVPESKDLLKNKPNRDILKLVQLPNCPWGCDLLQKAK